MMKRSLFILCLLAAMCVQAERWRTHFAYNNVTQIAMTPEQVYAISDGSMFSVDKYSGQIRVYNRQSGLHGTGITCIHYDAVGEQLIVCYATGKIDLLSSRGVMYIGELYDKEMTQRKTIRNVTIKGRTAYLSTDYGVQTLDLRENKLVDSYWLRPGGQETHVNDVLLANDSIYAFTDDSLFCAAMSSNIVDYSVWRRELRTGRIAPEEEKGTHYQDATGHWFASHGEGIVRFTETERLTYKPESPLVNIPYRMTAVQGGLWVVQGGRWDAQFGRGGVVMRYDGTNWTNVLPDGVVARTGMQALDYMNVAVDPENKNHYYVTSFGTGLYEFDHDTLVRHEIAGGANTLVSVVEELPGNYTRLDCATYGKDGSLWLLNTGELNQLQCIDAAGQWNAVTVMANGEPLALHTPAGLIFDNKHPDRIWIGLARYNTGLCMLDNRGTPLDGADDRTVLRNTWTDDEGNTFAPGRIYQIRQDTRGRIWMATNQGVAYINGEEFINTDLVHRPVVTDNNGENPVCNQSVSAVCETPDGRIWVGTEGLGVYVLNSDADRIEAQYTTDNSAMPGNGILSIESSETGVVYIGTSEGLAEYDPNGPGEGLQAADDRQTAEKEGVMKQWKLHFSYRGPRELANTPQRVFAATDGALFSVEKDDESIVYWNKETGLNGTSVSHICYDAQSGKLVVSYDDGRVDLIAQDGTVTQMPDLYMKAGSVAVGINCITAGSRYTYLGTSFGIVAVNPSKAEIADTYYIGSDAAAVEIQQIVESGDTLYAFSYDRMYKACLRDNLVDYTFWRSEQLPCEAVSHAAVWKGSLYTLQHDSLYRRVGSEWQLVSPNRLEWLHASGGQLLTFQPGYATMRMADDGQLQFVNGAYVAADAVYADGEYWLAESGEGLVRIGSSDSFFRPECPMNNFGYGLHVAHGRLYVAPGGRWDAQFGRQSSLSIYDGTHWTGIPWNRIYIASGSHDIRDAVSYAVDNSNPDHFFVATYGTGVFEFEGDAIRHYDATTPGCSLRAVDDEHIDAYFTRTDGAMMDAEGNLWVLNATSVGYPVHVRTPDGIWHPLRLRSGGKDIQFVTPGAIWTDRRDSRYKWLMDQRSDPGIILLDDGGTPAENWDDRCVKRSEFVDQNGNRLNPSRIKCLVQDHSNRIWIGTEKGIILIPASTDPFTSDACRRIIIPRNDGTGLGDYLLGDEQVNCFAVDGGNRMWIGTANSGLYLIEDDTITVAHFTETNSLLPSNSIQSVAIMPSTGEVFVGTDKGIASYRSDASEASEDMSGAYAYPNPVRPDYGGYISVAGLMDNTVVNIVDAGGNLVCKTRSHGGTAVWDGKLPDGRRATAGVYTALCNEPGGKHTVVKILVIR